MINEPIVGRVGFKRMNLVSRGVMMRHDNLMRCDACHMKYSMSELKKLAERWLCGYCLTDLCKNLPNGVENDKNNKE